MEGDFIVAKADTNFIERSEFTRELDPKKRSVRGNTLLERIHSGGRDTESGCRVWTGAKSTGGYGYLTFAGSNWLIHRLVWIYHKGRIPTGLIVRHRVCGNPLCHRIEHLDVGTQKENLADAIEHGTVRSRPGNSNGKARYTDAQVLEMRTSGLGLMECVRKYGGSEATVHSILTGKTWKHVGGPIRGIQNARGENSPSAKLTEEIVRTIRATSTHATELAALYGVSRRVIDDVRKGRSWKHILPSEEPQTDFQVSEGP